MANKRDLKKEIRYVCGDIAAECLLAKNFMKDIDPEAMKKVIMKVADLQVTALSNSSFSFDKVPSDFENGGAYRKARRDYYRKAYSSLREKFSNRVEEIVKEMNAARK